MPPEKSNHTLMETKEYQNSDTTKEPNFIQRFTGIIISPYKTMPYIVTKPRITFGIISALFAAIVYYLSRYSLFKVYVEQRAQMKMHEATTPISHAELNKEIVSKLVSTPVVTLMFWLILTALVFGLVKMLKGKGRFKQYLSITSYMHVTVWITYLAYFILSFFTGKLITDTSVVTLLNALSIEPESKFVIGLLRNIDIFSIWYFFILYVGVLVASKLPKEKILALVVFVFVVISLISASAA